MGATDHFSGFLLRGKFTDDSTPEDWYCNFGKIKVDLSSYVNHVTKEFEYWQVEKPVSLANLFYNVKIEELYDIRGTEKVEDLGRAFSTVSLIIADFSNLDLSSCTNMGDAFNSCGVLDLSSLANLDVSKVTGMSSIFRYARCKDLTPIADWDVSRVESFWYAFQAGPDDRLYRFNNWDVRSCKSFLNWMGDGSRRAVFEGSIKNISSTLEFHSQTYMSNEEAMIFINGLAEVEEPQTITFYRNTYATLTPEQIAIAESKNWIVAQI